jgi:hypothetical protein
LVRLLQNFSSFALAPDAQPPASRPPQSWALDTDDIRKAREKIRPKNHLTLYVQVCISPMLIILSAVGADIDI